MSKEPINFMVYPKRKSCKDNVATMYLRIFFEHEQTDKSLGITIPVTAWDPVTHAATSNPELNTRIIIKAESYKQKILSAYYLMRNSSESLCMKDILEVAIENKVPKMLSFLQCFEDSIQRMQELIGIEVTYANIQKHKVCLTHLRTFAKEQYRWNDFPFGKIDHKFVSGFIHYLKTKANCSHNTTVKHAQVFKKIYRIGIANGWVRRNAFADIKFSLKSVTRGYFTEADLAAWENVSLDNKKLELARDLFTFVVTQDLHILMLKI